MVDIFGNNIVSAFTGGNSVKAIYSYGDKVWPKIPGYDYCDYIRGRFEGIYEGTSSTSGTLVGEVPVIILNIPYVSGGITAEARILTAFRYSVQDKMVVFRAFGDYLGTEEHINSAYTSDQGPGSFTIQDGYCRSNFGAVRIQDNTFYNIKMTIPDDSYDSNIYVGDELYVDSHSYSKNHNVNPSNIKIVLFGESSRIDGSGHKLIYFKLKDINDNLLYDYVPVLRDSDGEPGLYETVNGTFHPKEQKLYTNTYVQTFRYGNII